MLISNIIEGVLYRRSYCPISKVLLFDIEGKKPLISEVRNRVTDIEVSCLRYRTNTLRYGLSISYVDIEGLSDVRYRRSCRDISSLTSYTIKDSANAIHCGVETPVKSFNICGPSPSLCMLITFKSPLSMAA
jgi:hypothetical protein